MIIFQVEVTNVGLVVTTANEQEAWAIYDRYCQISKFGMNLNAYGQTVYLIKDGEVISEYEPADQPYPHDVLARLGSSELLIIAKGIGLYPNNDDIPGTDPPRYSVMDFEQVIKDIVNQQYPNLDTHQCPFCTAETVDSEGIEDNLDTLEQKFTCLQCDRSWTVHYKLSHVELEEANG